MWGKKFGSAEQAYQWRKAVLHDNYFAASDFLILICPRAIKFKGSTVRTGRSWETLKVEVMYTILKAKADSCAEFRNFLIESWFII